MKILIGLLVWVIGLGDREPGEPFVGQARCLKCLHGWDILDPKGDLGICRDTELVCPECGYDKAKVL